ncbi:STAS domain-containing protein [Paracoccus sp. (in: a-proteobacteria)]
MQFHTDLIDDGVRVRVEEPRLDAAIAIRFKDRLRDVAARYGPRILLDLTPVQFMDSSGLGAVLAIRRILPEGHRLELTGLTPNVDRVFRLTRMDTVFTIHRDPDALPLPPAPDDEAER